EKIAFSADLGSGGVVVAELLMIKRGFHEIAEANRSALVDSAEQVRLERVWRTDQLRLPAQNQSAGETRLRQKLIFERARAMRLSRRLRTACLRLPPD